jgi:hypothetical protein
LRFLLWFVAGVVVAAAGWAVSMRFGDDVGGAVVGASILVGVGVASRWRG